MFAEFSENSPKVFSYNDPDVANLNCTLYIVHFRVSVCYLVPSFQKKYFLTANKKLQSEKSGNF